MIYEYKCQKCGKVQEKYHKMDEENKEPCEECKAPPQELVKQMPTVPKHGSWGRWSV